MEKPKTAIARDFMTIHDKVIALETDFPRRDVSFIDMLGYRIFNVTRPLYETARIFEGRVYNTKKGGPTLCFSIFDNRYYLPYEFAVEGQLSSNVSDAQYGDDGSLRRITADIGGPSLPTGNFSLDTHLPIIDIVLEEGCPMMKIRKSVIDYQDLYLNARILITESLETVNRSRACFKHGLLETKVSMTSQRLILEVNRPDGLQIITTLPTNIGAVDYAKMVKGDPGELIKLPTDEFQRLYKFDGANMENPIEITD